MTKLALTLWLIVLSAGAEAQTFWVKPNGSNRNDCESMRRPCATWQAAYDKAARINFSNRTVTIRSVPGKHRWTIAAGDMLRISHVWQGGTLRIIGDPKIPANVKLTAADGSVFRIGGGWIAGVTMAGAVVVEGFHLSAPKGYGLRHAGDGDVALGAMVWGPAAIHYGTEWFSARIRAFGIQTIEGDADHHADIDAGKAYLYNRLVIKGERTVRCFIRARNMGYAVLDWKVTLDEGTVTGQQACVRENSGISAQGVQIPGEGRDIKSAGVFIP